MDLALQLIMDQLNKLSAGQGGMKNDISSGLEAMRNEKAPAKT
jgi:hypothetical protein